MIPLAEPVLAGNEARYLAEAIESGYVSSAGPFVERFERQFADVVGARHAVTCASGTAALHVALRLAGAGPGRLVAVSDFTFIASANAAAYTGADLLLVDSAPDTWNMDTELLHDEVVRRAQMGERIPDVVEVVHVLGHPARMEPLLELRSRFGLRIVEDAAEALGASWTSGELEGRQVGTAGDLGCFSFNGNKIITTGGGGMIVTADEGLAAEAAHLTNQAKTAGAHYVHDTVGYNYRLSNLAAAVGVAQLERLPELLAAKRGIASRYDAWLSGLQATLPPRAAWARSSYWLYSVLVPSDGPAPRDVVLALSGAGALTRRVWPPLHQQLPYLSAERLGDGVASDLHRRGVSLPSSADLSITDQHVVACELGAVLGSRAAALPPG